eukprot:13221236-Alexandrium_andersonii.AAC.1
MPDDWEPPDWGRADFAGEGAEQGAITLHAAGDADCVYREAAAFVRELGPDEPAEHYMMARPLE